MKKATVSIVLGLIIVACGVLYGGQVLGLWAGYRGSLDGWWTLFIIVPCILSIITGGINIFNSIGTGVGVLLLLSQQNVFEHGLGYELIIPFVLVVFGLNMLLRKTMKFNKAGNSGVFVGSRGDNFFAVLGGNSPQFNGIDFRGANLFAIFGKVDLKLQNSIVRRDCVINTYCVFGGTEISLPKNVRVIISSTPIFGGINNQFTSEPRENQTTVLIRAFTVFGNIEIK